MKSILVFVSFVALTCSAPQSRKAFHEHVEDFLNIIMEESQGELEHLFGHYVEFEEFTTSLDYMYTANFKELVYEMESIPEFKMVVDFLEKDNIDIMYYIDLYNTMIEEAVPEPRKIRHNLSGTDFSAFIADCIAVFPHSKLQALYAEKMSESEEFKTAMDNLYSEEWNQIYKSLWENEIFKKEVQNLMDKGIDIRAVLKELKAVFGQL